MLETLFLLTSLWTEFVPTTCTSTLAMEPARRYYFLPLRSWMCTRQRIPINLPSWGLHLSLQYLSSQALKTAYMNSAALLMGCSSGRLRDCGDYEATGVVLSYFTAGEVFAILYRWKFCRVRCFESWLQTGCPAAVTNLWDVTDRDIDRFSRCLLEKWIGAPGQDDENRRSSCAREGPHSAQLSETVSFGRKSCRLPYLTGAAPVCYGIPTQVKLQLVSGI